MATFKCRTLVPQISEWYEQEAEDADEAANGFHFRHVPDIGAAWGPVGSLGIMHDGAQVYFALVEVEGHEPVVSKVYRHGIWRRGGVKPANQPTISEIAKKLGWEHNPDELLNEWEGEETQDEASARKF